MRQFDPTRLREARLAEGLSRTELAVKCGCVEQTVEAWERGVRRPGAALLVTVAEVLHVGVDVLMREVPAQVAS
jgi:transcriptional regulator with XRE-family HTH domain